MVLKRLGFYMMFLQVDETDYKNQEVDKMKKLLALLLLFGIVGCGESADSRYDSGYSDGYAAGYNTTCGLRATMIEGDWSDSNYTSGYNEGYSDGSKDCKK